MGILLLPRVRPNRHESRSTTTAAPGRKLAVDLDGTVAVYPNEVSRFVARVVVFEIDLSVEHIAAILNINARMIARTSNSNELDSEAVLFVVAVGRLTAQARLRSAAERLRQARDGLPADYAADEWTTQELRFTLRTLSHPSSREQAILEAISRSARECMPEPGEKIRAIPATRREIESGAVDFSPGYLPLEQAVANTRQREMNAGMRRAGKRPIHDAVISYTVNT